MLKNCEGGESSALWKEHTSIKVNSPVSGAGHVTTHSAVDAYDMVLQYAGACNYRDKLDELIISDVRKGCGNLYRQCQRMGIIEGMVG